MAPRARRAGLTKGEVLGRAEAPLLFRGDLLPFLEGVVMRWPLRSYIASLILDPQTEIDVGLIICV